jgi:ABC-2 type transport system permease protein
MALSVATAVVLFGVPFRGSFLTLALVSVVFMWAALGQGLLISTVTRSQLVAAQASILSAFMPAFYFSNFVFEIGSMPWPLRLVSYAVPARYYVSSLQTLFLAGDVPDVILADLLGLVAIAVCFTALTALKTRTRLE